MKNIVLIGMMGCGKTTVARILSRILRKTVIDMDDYLEEKYQQSIPEIFLKGESYFRDLESICISEVSKRENIIISTGGGVVLRNENIKELKQNGIIIYIDRPIEDIVSDVDIASRPLLKEGSKKAIELFNKRNPLYLEACDYHVISNGTIDDVVNKVLKLLNT